LSNSNSSRRWWVTGCIVVAILAAIWIKVRVEAGHSLEQAQQLESQGELELSIVCYRRTVRWYSPLSSPVKQSIEGLWAIGQEYEQKGDSRIALLAYRSIRSSLIGIRSVYQPYEAFISKSSERIAALMAQAEGTEAHKFPEENLKSGDWFRDQGIYGLLVELLVEQYDAHKDGGHHRYNRDRKKTKILNHTNLLTTNSQLCQRPTCQVEQHPQHN